jgi:phosphogluconate dehydratase
LNKVLQQVTERIQNRSRATRSDYLGRIDAALGDGPARERLSCGNLAHGFAACSKEDKDGLTANRRSNIAIISAYNDMLSAHQPYKDTPDLIKEAIHQAGGIAQFAGGVPAMCDGVTQGRAGMELSLFSRDVIAMATGVALSHDMFDGVLCLGICDKIVPGLLIGSLAFGHLPMIFVPSGPMPSGVPNDEKARIRQLYAEGKAGRDELLAVESASYHSPGTCTFYGTANSNQMLMEIMGLQLPGSSFVNPGTALREALTREAATEILGITAQSDACRPLGHMVDEKALVNGIVGLLATGGSTNHTLHLIAIARAAGVQLNWDDFSELSSVVPLLARVYPNGSADINHFHAAGGMSLLIGSLLDEGLLHADVQTVCGDNGLEDYRKEPVLEQDKLVWRQGISNSLDNSVLVKPDKPFSPHGGLSLLTGNLGRAVIKTSSLKPEHYVVQAPAIVFNDQHELEAEFKAGKLYRDFIAVIRYQGPRANGMPELHKLTPVLGAIQAKNYQVALVTDGRMSGASGKVPAAIHVSPECLSGGPLAKVTDGDIVRLDSEAGTLEGLVSAEELNNRIVAAPDLSSNGFGVGRELFSLFRENADLAENGASCLPGFPRGQ